MATAALRINPGGQLSPDQVVGRDSFIASMWHALDQQSVLLTGERRMGKTSVLHKMVAEADEKRMPINRSLQTIASTDEFVRYLIADIEATLPGVLKKSVGSRFKKLGITQIGITPVSVTFVPTSPQSWKEAVDAALQAVNDDVDVPVVFLWDELPHMVANIHRDQGPGMARQLLDCLRAVRERHDSIRMVFSGSFGLHHVLKDLREHGGMWAPTHDMLVLDLPTLCEPDARFLAGALLTSGKISCDNVAGVAAAIAETVDGAPYYVHLAVADTRRWQQTHHTAVTAAKVSELIDTRLRDPLDPWQLNHYVDRIVAYYGTDAAIAKGVLDAIALTSPPPDIDAIYAALSAQGPPPERERLRGIVALLGMDHYSGPGPHYDFKLPFVRRVWRARRGLT